MQKFQGKYRIESARAKWWDYNKSGSYFITICTKNREHLFGYIKDGEMILNEYGQIVLECWLDLPNHYENIILGEFQIMPNHIHCIVGVDNSKNNHDANDNSEKKSHGVFEFIRALKSFSSRKINEKRNSKGVSNWQERFHDHIIRNDSEYHRIANYIINNPKKWDEDCFYK
ncbi:transposase [Flavobacterium agrisoli]|uniref:Transposase n=1 Tax=Flavobacterium agrisoli TaxID=2793066 RepID=A0A934PM83_9FLAO|nr:transposase [Flavobacterium agrisoli]MBK0369410.1 transposase [Flavobacterium agrisoli]